MMFSSISQKDQVITRALVIMYVQYNVLYILYITFYIQQYHSYAGFQKPSLLNHDGIMYHHK